MKRDLKVITARNSKDFKEENLKNIKIAINFLIALVEQKAQNVRIRDEVRKCADSLRWQLLGTMIQTAVAVQHSRRQLSL